MTNKTTTLLLALYALLVIAGVAVSELVHPWIGIAMTIGASGLLMWTLGQRYALAADEELERMRQRLREQDEMYAELRDKGEQK
jgi:hypothetical protein